MKRAITRLLPVLLAAALLFGTAQGVLADASYATGVSLNQTDATLYIRNGNQPTLTLTATPRPSDYSGDISWDISGSSNVLRLSSYSGRRVTVTALRTGTATVDATVRTSSGALRSDSCTVTVREDKIEGYYLERNSYTLAPGASIQVVAVARYLSGYEEYATRFSVEDSKIATVDNNGVLRATSPGRTTVTARFADNTTRSATLTVSVGAISTVSTINDFTVEVSLGKNLNLGELYNNLAQRFSNAGGNVNYARVSFEHVGNANYGYLYETAALGARVENGYEGTFRSIEQMVFVPAGEGDYVIDYKATDENLVLTGTITIKSKIQPKSISFTVEENGNYSFSMVNKDGTTALSLISDIAGSYGSLKFGEITAGSHVGTLYTSSAQIRANLVTKGTVVEAQDVGNLYFVPSRSGVYRIGYTAYSGSNAGGATVSQGTLAIAVGTNSLNIIINLDSNQEEYIFDRSTRKSPSGASATIQDAIDAAVGESNWRYLRFDTPSEADSLIGTLYEYSYATSAISPASYISYRDLKYLCFRPLKPGTFKIGYSIFTQETVGSLVASGTLQIVVPSIDYGSLELAYSVPTGGSISLKDADFERWFQGNHSDNYRLSHVVFEEYENDFGTFLHDNDMFVPYNSADYYTEAGAQYAGENARLLSHISFRAPGTTGYQAVKYTCYGTNGLLGSTSTYTRDSGLMYIFVTAGEVPSITYNAINSFGVSLKDADFLSAYRSAMAVDENAKPEFSIQILTVPTRGTLYYDANASGRTSTRITNSNKDTYSFYINGGTSGSSGSRNSLDTLTYVPDTHGSAPETVRYIAFSQAGKELFTGKIIFRYSEGKSLNCGSEGYGFTVSDFASDYDAPLYVSFKKPASGKLYANFANGRGTELLESDRVYLAVPEANGFSVRDIVFIPRAGEYGTVNLDYTVYTSDGDSYTETIRMSVSGKRNSDLFLDVTAADVGTWAADAIDFSNKWGLVGGTSDIPALFSPNENMRRRDLVLILYRMAGSPRVSGALRFTDVPANAYYYDSALWADRLDLTEGIVTNDRFDPDGFITRQDFAVLLYNFTASLRVNMASTGSLRSYQDMQLISPYAVNAMTWAVEKGYVTSASERELRLAPLDPATRAELAVMLHRYITY